jgi:SAM-dependent methyltransferase
MDPRNHWDAVYTAKMPETVSWYAPHLERSLDYIAKAGLGPAAAIVDVGGGESTLVDDLLAAGYRDLSVLDISAKALEVAAARLGARASAVRWIAADVLQHDFAPASFDLWHDRAVFHFLVTDAQREAYVRQALNALRPGGYAIVGTFGPHGPEQCSSLSVMRYAAQELHAVFGAPFTLVEHGEDLHRTPWGSPQEFVYCLCRRADAATALIHPNRRPPT